MRPRLRRGVVAGHSPLRALPVKTDFLVVALGASAGGLDAFRSLFDALPDLMRAKRTWF